MKKRVNGEIFSYMSNSVVTVIQIKLIALNSSVFTAESVSKINAGGRQQDIVILSQPNTLAR